MFSGRWLAEVQDVTESAEERDAGWGPRAKPGWRAPEPPLRETIDALGSPGFCPVEAGREAAAVARARFSSDSTSTAAPIGSAPRRAPATPPRTATLLVGVRRRRAYQ